MQIKIIDMLTVISAFSMLAPAAFADAPFILNQQSGLVSNYTTKLLVASDGSVYIGTAQGLSRFKDGAIVNNFTDANGRKLEVVTALGEGKRILDGRVEYDILIGKGRITGSNSTLGYGFEKLVFNEDGHWGWGNTSDPIYTRYSNRWINAVSVNASQEVEVLALNHTSASGRSNVGEASISTDLNFVGAFDFLSGESLYSIIDWNNQKLLGGDDGLFVFDELTHAIKHVDVSSWHGSGGFLDASANKNIRAMVKDSQGNVWIGLQADSYVGGGLVQFTPDAMDLLSGSWKPVIRLPGTTINSNHVNALVFDNGGNLWIATDDGLKRRDTAGNFIDLGIAHGLPSAKINDIAFDEKNGYLWVGTDNGVARLTT